MALQTFEFNGPTGVSLIIRLFNLGVEDDAIVDFGTPTEKVNDLNRFYIEFDVPEGAYRLNGLVQDGLDLIGGLVNEEYDVPSTPGIVLPRSETMVSVYEVGERMIPFLIQDEDDNVIPNVVVSIQTSGGLPIAGKKRTSNISGIAEIPLTDGSFKGFVSVGPGYETHVAEEFTVDGDTEQVVLTIVSAAPSTPDAPGMCAVDCYVYEGATPVEGAKVWAKLCDKNSTTDGVFLSTKPFYVLTDALGKAVLQLVQQGMFTNGSGEYLITCLEGDSKFVDQKVTAPNTSTANLEDLLP